MAWDLEQFKPRWEGCSLTRRFLAYVVDLFCIVASAVLVKWKVLPLFDLQGEWMYYFTDIFVIFFYFWLFESFLWGAGLGKLLFGIRVVDDDGNLITTTQSLMRTLGIFLTILFLRMMAAGNAQTDARVYEHGGFKMNHVDEREWLDFFSDTWVVKVQELKEKQEKGKI